uniref:Reverse transcriptase domain-containing protein n=1 Tax=Tanacetum cinerariifolium TaxID=118510 RepID=A0A699GSN5_TANCI|nr:reverse transcriptase domain-containing protein [Tanacetum cinerariifolium]
MRTRNSYFLNNSPATIPRRQNKKSTPNVVKPELRTIVEMADNCTMEELLQAPTEGYEEAIVILKINTNHFEITNLLQLVQANPYHGFERENPHTHINNFKRITSTLKFRDVPNDVIMVMMFPYSLEGNARVWYDKEPPNLILTWEVLINKFMNQFFPPSKTTHLKNKISRFTQRFEVTFGEAWEQFKEMLRACPHHGFTELAQIDTLYNGLNDNDEDSLNAAAGGNLLIKAVEESCVTCDGNNAYYNCPNTDSNQPSVCVVTGTYNQVALQNRARISWHHLNQASTSGTLPSNTIPNPKGEMKAITTRSGSTAHIQPPVTLILKPDVLKTLHKLNLPYPLRHNDQKLREKATNQMEKFFQIFQDLHFDISFANALILMPKFASTIKSLLTNKEKLFKLAKIPLNENCSAVLLKKLGDPVKFLIPCDFPGIDLSLPEVTPTRMTLELADRSITRPKGVAEDVFVKVRKFHFLTDFVVVDFEADPCIPLILGISFLRTSGALIDIYGEEITLRVNDEAFTSNLNQTTRYSSTYDDLSQGELGKMKSLTEELPELELKEIPSHLEYAYLEGVDKLPMIISKGLEIDEKEALLKVLKYKRAIAWTITDIKGIDPRFCTHKILMEDDYKPAVQSQRQVNPKIHKVIKKEVIKLLDANMIYPISDSPWVIPIHCVPKKGGITVVENENNELISTRMPFGLFNAPGTFQRCMMAIFHDMIEKTMEVFMDDFSVFGDSFSSCPSHLDTMLQRCVHGQEAFDILKACHEGLIGGHHGANFTAKKVFDAVDYLSKWVEAKALPTNNARVVVKTVGEKRASWSEKLVDALWAFRTAYKTPIECTPYKLVYGKSCHLPIELEHKAYWALKHVNFDLKTAGDHRKLQLNELNELRDQAYKNYLIYKEKTKKIHDSKIKNRIFNVGDRVLLFNSHFKIFLGKLKTRWSRPFTITKVFPYGTVELSQTDGPNFKVNGHRVKHYFGGDVPQLVVLDFQTSP